MSRPFTFEDIQKMVDARPKPGEETFQPLIQKMADAKTLERVKEYITKTEVDSRCNNA